MSVISASDIDADNICSCVSDFDFVWVLYHVFKIAYLNGDCFALWIIAQSEKFNLLRFRLRAKVGPHHLDGDPMHLLRPGDEIEHSLPILLFEDERLHERHLGLLFPQKFAQIARPTL